MFHQLVMNIFSADMTNAVLGLSLSVYKMLSFSVIGYLQSNWDFLLGIQSFDDECQLRLYIQGETLTDNNIGISVQPC